VDDVTGRVPQARFRREPIKTAFRFLALTILPSVLSSCLIAPHGRYYKPSYPDGTASLIRRDCGGSVGPPSVLKVPIPDGAIRVTLREKPQDELALSMWLETSGLSNLQFTSNLIRLSDPENGREWAIEAKHLTIGIPKGRISYSDVVNFEKLLPVAPEYVTKDMELWIPFSINDFSPDRVRVYLPPILNESEKYETPPMVLDANREGKGIEGYKKSWGWWPYEWKEIEVGPLRFRGAATGGVRQGSKADSTAGAPGLAGNIMIDSPADLKWQFATNEIRFEEPGSGKVQVFQFEDLRIVSDVRVTFTAPFCCSTHVSMADLPLGEARSEKLLIQLPTLLVNGKEIVIKPIAFDLKRFEFGIYPLNC